MNSTPLAAIGARTVMHQDREPKLARADQHDRHDASQRIGKDRDQRDRAEDHSRGNRDQRDALPLDALTQRRESSSGANSSRAGMRSAAILAAVTTSASPTTNR
jgi:hypothetical protein